MALEDDLYRIEQKLWIGTADDYRRNVDDRCLTVFTEMAGVMDREAIAQSAGGGRRWAELSLERKGFINPAPDSAMISYQTNARRAEGGRYRALVSSLYVRRGQDWKMAFHQQTPLESK